MVLYTTQIYEKGMFALMEVTIEVGWQGWQQQIGDNINPIKPT